MTHPARPNLVIIVADDTTPSYHGCYGGPTPTPNIDRLAREGILMQRGYGCASLCCPSRYTLFTGQYTQRSTAAHAHVPPGDPALISQNGELDDGQTTLPRLLARAGYFTGHIGKWHSRFETNSLGFAEPVIPIGDPDDPAFNARLIDAQARAQEVVRRCAGFEHAACVHWGNLDATFKKSQTLGAHNPAWFTDGALDFLDRALADERPFYLHLANSVPHTPDCHLSLNRDHRYTVGGKLAQPPASHPPDDSVLARMKAAGLPTSGPLAGVNAGQIQIDDQIGVLVARLEAAGQLDNTIFIYTADHGIPGKGSCHITGHHLPFILRWPAGGIAPRVVHDIFSWAHIVPTLAEACVILFPETALPDGISVLPALRNPAAPWPCATAYHEMGWSRSITKGRYHYIATRPPASVIDTIRKGHSEAISTGLFFDSLNAPAIPGYFDPDQLYDIELDPYEQHNLIHDPSRARILAELRRELFAITRTLPRPFPETPAPFLSTPEYGELLARRHAEMRQIQHYPTRAAHVPAVWHGNLADPDLA